MYLTQPSIKQLLVSLLSLTLLFNLNFPALAHTSTQDTSFNLQRTDSGFYGTYTVGDVEYLYNVNRQLQLHESYIQKGNGKNIASCVLYKDKVTVTLSGVAIEFNMSDQTMAPLSDAELTALRDFSTGSDAAVAREVVENIVIRSDSLSPQSLFGFVVLGMILGDGNNEARDGTHRSPKNAGNKQSLSQLLKTELAHAFESSPRKAEVLRECKRKAVRAKAKGKSRNARTVAPLGPCHGCCGAGCWGCTGVYTPACFAHDNCVAQYGYWDPRCLALLALAMYSYHQAICPLCV